MGHTPGPWEVILSERPDNPCIITGQGLAVATCYLSDSGTNVDNANLIAAAPALLAACVAVNDWILGYMDFGKRPCPFCDHYHVHSEDCLYITLQAAITSAEA